MCETFRPNYFADCSLYLSTFRSSSIFPHTHARGPEPPVWQGIKAPRRGFFSSDSKGKNRQGILSHGVHIFIAVSCNLGNLILSRKDSVDENKAIRGDLSIFAARYIKLKKDITLNVTALRHGASHCKICQKSRVECSRSIVNDLVYGRT